MNNYMKKLNKKLIAGILALLLIILGVGGYFSLQAFKNVENIIQSKSSEYVRNRHSNVEHKIIICKKDLLNPVSIFLLKLNGDKDTVSGFYTNLHRNNPFVEFDTSDYQGESGNTIFSTETNLQKVSNWYEQKGCDYFKQNGTIENTSFTYNPPLTPQQIQKAQADQQSSTNQQQYLDPITKEPEGAYKACVVVLEYFKRVEQAIKEGKTEIYNDITKENIPLDSTQLTKAQSVIESQQKQCDNQKSK
jgi:hypothetical protein